MEAVTDASALHDHLATDASYLKNALYPYNRQEFNQFCRKLLQP